MVIGVRKNYYAILGVTPDSDESEVKSAYRRMVRKYHPDVNKSPESSKNFKDILEAYEVLSDNNRRKQYDMLNGFYKSPKQKENSKNINNNYRKPFEERGISQNNDDKNQQNTTFEENKYAFQKNNFKNTINDIFDGITKEDKRKKVPRKGADIHTELVITLEDSIKGTSRVVNVIHKELCPSCEGRKFINGSKCGTCNGTGEYSQHKKITVKIPPNVKNGSKLRISGEGNPGFNGGENGNLYLTVKIQPNSHISVEGPNIHYKLPITPCEAVLGGKIQVPIFGGNVNFIIPKNTKSGQIFRLANQGVKTNGKFGDMIITVEIQIPKDLTDDEIKLYEKLNRLAHGNVREDLLNG